MINKKIFIVTGSNTGIGKEIARGIAKEGPGNKVVLACRNFEKGKKTLEEFEKSGIPISNLKVMQVDLSKQSSIKNFVNQYKAEFNSLYCLVNNASIGPKEMEISEDGIELSFATNVMGYYLLSKLFSDLLIKSAPSRIVNVASNYAGGLNIDDINYEKDRYDQQGAYRRSKQADRMLSWIFSQKLQDKGVTVNACTPGMIDTSLLHTLGFNGGGTPENGAKTPLWLATSKDVEGITGKYFDTKQEKVCSFRNPKQLEALWLKLESLSKI
jgi:NAD(P)-dependent dehydrogenase (short-subunit alcohol dehydrogenase family)